MQSSDKSPFDQYAERYQELIEESVRISGYQKSFFDEYKIRELVRVLRIRSLHDQSLRILNYGCGIGQSERFLSVLLPTSTIFGVDPSRASIDMARSANSSAQNVLFGIMESGMIPFEGRFDVILAANVFHHIRKTDHASVLRQLKERLSPQGLLFIFEHNPFNPLTVRIVRACPVDRDAELLKPRYLRNLLTTAGLSPLPARFTLFFPRFLSLLSPLEKMLHWVPLGAQYYVVASRTASTG